MTTWLPIYQILENDSTTIKVHMYMDKIAKSGACGGFVNFLDFRLINLMLESVENQVHVLLVSHNPSIHSIIALPIRYIMDGIIF